MIDYTRAAIDKTLNDFKRFGFVFNIVIESLSIIYLIYAIIAGAGFIFVNIPLAVISVSYLVFFVITGRDLEKKKLCESAKQKYRILKIAVHTLNLGVTIYGIYIASEELSFISIVMAAATTIGWALNLLITFTVNYLSAKANFIIKAIEADIEHTMRPVEKVTNFIKRVKGEEVEPKEPPDKTRVLLESTVQAFREKRRAEKERRMAERLQKRKEKSGFKNVILEVHDEDSEKIKK